MDLIYVSSVAVVFRYSVPLLSHRISSFLPNQKVNAYLKLLLASWATGFAFLRLCFSHDVTLFRSFHLNTFLAFCGPKDTILEEISDFFSGETFVEKKQVGYWNPPPLLGERIGCKVEMHEYFTRASLSSVSRKTLGQPWGIKNRTGWAVGTEALILELLRWKCMGPVISGSFRNEPALLLLGPASRPCSSGSSCSLSASTRPPTGPLQLQVFFPFLSFWPKNPRCLRWVFCYFWHYCVLGGM